MNLADFSNSKEMIREVAKDIWVAEQPLRYLGLSIGTRMTVIRLTNSPELLVISPIQVSDAMVRQLNKLGTVTHLIAPNLYHYFFAAEFKALYPQATFWAAPGLAEKKPDLPIDRTIGNDYSSEWPGLECILLDGFRTLGSGGLDSLNECVFFHLASRTLVLTDAAFNFDESFPWLTQLAARIGGGYRSLSPSLLEKIATTEKEKVRRSIEKILNWDFDRVVMAHGSIVNQNGKEKLRQGYEEFLS